MSYNDKVGKQRRLHSVLVYKTQNRVETVRGPQFTLGVINRDNNAVENIRRIFEHYLRFKNGEEGYTASRPWVFQRSVKKEDIQAKARIITSGVDQSSSGQTTPSLTAAVLLQEGQ